MPAKTRMVSCQIIRFERPGIASFAGDPLQVNEDGCKDMSGNFVIPFSKKFQQTIRLASRDGSRPVPTGKVNFVVYWQVEDGVEVRVVLPEVGFVQIQNIPILKKNYGIRSSCTVSP